MVDMECICDVPCDCKKKRASHQKDKGTAQCNIDCRCGQCLVTRHPRNCQCVRCKRRRDVQSKEDVNIKEKLITRSKGRPEERSKGRPEEGPKGRPEENVISTPIFRRKRCKKKKKKKSITESVTPVRLEDLDPTTGDRIRMTLVELWPNGKLGEEKMKGEKRREEEERKEDEKKKEMKERDEKNEGTERQIEEMNEVGDQPDVSTDANDNNDKGAGDRSALQVQLNVRSFGFYLNQKLSPSTFLCLCLTLLIFFTSPTWAEKYRVEINQDHYIDITSSANAVLLDSFESQKNLKSCSESFPKGGLLYIKNEVEKWEGILAEMKRFRLRPLHGSSRCVHLTHPAPSDPTIGPYPQLIAHVPSHPESIYMTMIQQGEGQALNCVYTIKESFVEKFVNFEPTLKNYRNLFPKKCRSQVQQGMIYPTEEKDKSERKNYEIVQFKDQHPANLFKCVEMCLHLQKRENLNSSCADLPGLNDCENRQGCSWFAFHRDTNFCLLYYKKHLDENHKKFTSYDFFQQGSGYANRGIFSPIDCLPDFQTKPILIRGKDSQHHPTWLDPRAACQYAPIIEESYMIFESCAMDADFLELHLTQIKNRLHNFEKKYNLDKISQSGKRVRRSPVIQKAVSVVTPQLQKYILSMLISSFPLKAVTLAAAGPVVGILLLLTTSLISIVTQLAVESGAHILAKGVHDMDRLHSQNDMESEQIYQALDIRYMKGKESETFYKQSSPFHAMNNLSIMVEDTIESLEKILQSKSPLSQSINLELKDREFTYIILDKLDHFRKIYYYYSNHTQQGIKQKVSALFSLDQQYSLYEGTLANLETVSSYPSYKCVDGFRRNEKFGEECFSGSLEEKAMKYFHISEDKILLKVLRKALVEVDCPQQQGKTFSAGVFLILASKSCRIQVDGNLIFPGNPQRLLGVFQILLDREANQSEKVHGKLAKFVAHEALKSQVYSVGILYILSTGSLVLIILLSCKKGNKKKEKIEQRSYRYQPRLLPMTDLSSIIDPSSSPMAKRKQEKK